MFSKQVRIVLAIIEREGNILMLQRKDTNPMWDRKWEFPGGKIERGEEVGETLVREVLEETGLALAESHAMEIHHHDWPLPTHTLHVEIHPFACLAGKGDVQIEIDKAYEGRWVPIEEVESYDCLRANSDIFKKFKQTHVQNLG